MNSKSNDQTSPKNEQKPSHQGRKKLPPMSLEEAIGIAFNYQSRFSDQLDDQVRHSHFNHHASGGYKRAQRIIKSERLNDEENFKKTANNLLYKDIISQGFYDILLDVRAPPPLKNTEQHPTEREIMDENATIGIEFADATDPAAIGTAILSARNFAELSQTQLIDKTGISLRTLSRLESGKATNLPTLKTLDEIAKATGTELSISFKPK